MKNDDDDDDVFVYLMNPKLNKIEQNRFDLSISIECILFLLTNETDVFFLHRSFLTDSISDKFLLESNYL